MEGLLIVLIPMFAGYLIKIKRQILLRHINRVSMLLLYIILLLMGISLGQLDNLAQQLPIIGISALTFACFTQGFNLIGLLSYDKLSPQPLKRAAQQTGSRLKLLFDSFKLCAMVALGFVVGYFSKGILFLPFGTSTYVLIALIFLVGIQLRNNGISLREVFFNSRGIYTGLIMVATSLLGGMVAALVLNLPVAQGLALASGLGWYSLSSVVLNDAWGPVFGSIAFVNDLSREILSLFLIPFLMPNYRSAAVGISGATALDCTLPVIQRSGGMEVVPLAISFGFVTNILPPLLLVFFTALPL
ncbi:uncharacterized membrane protein YbjE (DUF340 family) [Mesocricetibacter intestinalis]|uniref:Uncharacterized membrane protein YbjE (DUF340 family) n=2 Tax=Mesocricetibacter intestinalis TaxID=1521930 RepID=A0A4V3D9K4_9PAST|nr:uncharacterized membrane protein YbjE (DUF340 family) [Mesocricetibacter intestinalis]